MRKIVIGTHHKAGTNFFMSCLRALSRKQIISLWEVSQDPLSQHEPPIWDVHFDHWSQWKIDLDKYDFRGMHCIRNPMSLVFSSVNYHLKSDEAWLHVAKPRLCGLTYSQYLRTLPSLKEQMIFEMQSSTGTVIKQMYDAFKDKRFYHIQLENISFDAKMSQISEAFDFIGLDSDQQRIWKDIFRTRCMWNLPKLPTHSTSGMSENWRSLIDNDTLKFYFEKFGDIEVEMGYGNYKELLK